MHRQRPAWMPAISTLSLLLLAGTACRPTGDQQAARAQQWNAAAIAAATPHFADRFGTYGRHETLRFKRGDTLETLLRRAGVPSQERFALIDAVAETFDMSDFKAGAEVVLRWDLAGRLLGLAYPLDYLDDLYAWRRGEGFTAETVHATLEWEPRLLTAVLESSFYETFEAQGEDGNLAVRVADLFGGEVDFFLDLQPGDRMEVLVESAQRPDRETSRNRILAAWMEVGGKRHAAYLDPKTALGERRYYHADGSSLERQFLKAPLSFSRISSGFSHSRLHPVLGVHRPHLGVDYAAPIGTPVHATADGSVLRRGHDRGMGRFVVLRHPGRIETTYMHLSSFAGGTSVGARVKRGQVIGAVGSSGLSTGPHLDYRMKVNGAFIDPRKFRAVAGEPLPTAQRTAFAAAVARYDSLLGALATPTLVPALASAAPSK